MSFPPIDPETLRRWDKEHLWHPFTAQADWAAGEPLIIDRAEGAELIDTRGRRYLDGVSSLWCNVHGHRHPTIDAAIREQLDKVAHTTMLGLSHPTAIELARKLVELAPPGLTRVFYSDDGATAVEVSLKMAYQYWRQKADPEPERSMFVALGGAYHGDTIGDVSLGGVDRFHAMFRPLLFPVLRAPIPFCYRCPLGLERTSCLTACLDEVEHLLRAHPGQVAGVVIEPIVQGAAGMVTHPAGYLEGLRRLTRKHGTLLIADEVAVGFGRTGRMFACEHEGVSPDFLCLAKGITGGYLPLAATMTTEEVYSAFFATAAQGKTFQHGHTYGGNPLGAAAALATLRVFEEERTLERIGPLADRLALHLGRFSSLRHVGEVRQRGLMAGIELVLDRGSKAEFPSHQQVGNRVCRMARELGVLIRPLGDVLVVMPPLSLTGSQLDRMMDVMLRCVVEVTERN
ncbi:adenosylmethionine--8-amino-7-oxononanoate transaminase [Tautonia plasticadhaerens]|uniref:Adenosylmethionine-8-amino-7-oxononanoate aminotransferase n=1 Tax=Tautonia plasticadhaerens TaxID=2527974 RepID=A0A518H8N1_9BACT|nr:adenosylmethionine--8-amino-7-oxononanoate transaminase [Tautonia plasticadhaerens]QDV37199.1 L-Lysine-8-amino-7-oxononanoate aminotransferase [Tautonia plasticadhaerens]